MPTVQAATTTVDIAPRIAQLPRPEEIIERNLTVRDVLTGEVISVLELLSPTVAPQPLPEARARNERTL